MMPAIAKYNVGDWVRFYQAARLVIGEVRYKRYDSFISRWKYITDVGNVHEDSILEARCPAA